MKKLPVALSSAALIVAMLAFASLSGAASKSHQKTVKASLVAKKKPAKPRRGPRGYRGLRGAVGPAGPQGPKGAQGPQGTTGAQGAQGVQGPKGDPGPSNAIVRSNDAQVRLPFVGGARVPVVSMLGIPGGSYVFSAKTVAVQFATIQDFVRCDVVAGKGLSTTAVDLTTVKSGNSTGASQVAPLTMMGGFTSVTRFDATLRCWHDADIDGLTYSAPYMESSRLVATAVGEVDGGVR